MKLTENYIFNALLVMALYHIFISDDKANILWVILFKKNLDTRRMHFIENRTKTKLPYLVTNVLYTSVVTTVLF